MALTDQERIEILWKNYDRGVNAIKATPDYAQFTGPVSDEIIAEAEKLVGLTFPPTYRRFLKEFGSGMIGGGGEIFGIPSNDVERMKRDGVSITRNTLRFRDDMQKDYPNYYRRHKKKINSFLVFFDWGNGDLEGLDCSKTDFRAENPTKVLDHASREFEESYNSFASFFRILMERQAKEYQQS